MDFETTKAQRAAASTKIVIAGGFGVGKSTLVGAVSEIDPLRIATAIERRFVPTEASHCPTRVKVCDGMCSACAADGAMRA